MPRFPKPPKGAKPVEVLVHADTRRNIPTAEFQSIAQRLEEDTPVPPARYARAAPLPNGEVRARNADLDPQIVWQGARIRLTDAQRKQLLETGEIELGEAQLVWRGKDAQDWSDLVVNPPPIYIQEKVHPKVIIDGLQKEARGRAEAANDAPDLFADFNGLNDPEARLEFYQHDQHWSNRMILGDSLQVMASLAEREGLRGKVQCIYFDPPYGIKFNSNWQVSTLSRDVKDGKREDVSREPEQVKAFRDTWKDGIHSYLTYLRDRLTVARELLIESGSIFVQIGDENVHLVRSVIDEVFGADNICAEIVFTKATGLTNELIPSVFDYILWFAKNRRATKFRRLVRERDLAADKQGEFRAADPLLVVPGRPETGIYRTNSAISPGVRANTTGAFSYLGRRFESGPTRNWKTVIPGMTRLAMANRLELEASPSRMYKQYWTDFPYIDTTNIWNDVRSEQDRVYVVQTVEKVVQRCILMSTDPGDLVLDPTCGSGTAATVAEQWGRRWITVDTSRVALALARNRLMAAKYPYYLLADSREGRVKEQAVSGRVQPETATHNDVRHGFVYDRAPHVSLKSIASNTEIDMLWDQAQQILEPLRARLNTTLGTGWQEWQIPRDADPAWPAEAARDHAAWWAARIERQRNIDASIAAALISNFSTIAPTRTALGSGWLVPSPSKAYPHTGWSRPMRTNCSTSLPCPANVGALPRRRSTLPPWSWTISALPGCIKAARRTAFASPACSPGPATTSARKGASRRARQNAAPPS